MSLGSPRRVRWSDMPSHTPLPLEPLRQFEDREQGFDLDAIYRIDTRLRGTKVVLQ